jgi:predicted small metal-binding protein
MRQRVEPSIGPTAREEFDMQYETTCECGWSASGTRDDLVRLVQEHGREVHGMDVTAEQAIAQMKPVQA